MNSDILSGQWTNLKGKVKETFGKLTDDDLLQMQGSRERIVGALQERYGYSKLEAQREWDNFLNQHSTTLEESSDSVIDTVKATAASAVDSAARMVEKVADKVEHAVKQN